MPQQRKPRAILLAFAALAALALAAPAAIAANAEYKGISEDGGVAVFSTTDPLVAGDTDILSDVYVREFDEELGPVTREVSLGLTGGNDSYSAQYLGLDAAGDKVLFATKERLAAADKDTAEDVYVRDLAVNQTTLVSAGDPSCAGSGCGTANVDAGAAPGGIVDEGERIFFVSSEQLSSEDTDSGADLYMRDMTGGLTKLVSAAAPLCGGCGGGIKPVNFQGASSDGSEAIFTTTEKLTGVDTDEEELDLYERDIEVGETNLVTTPGGGLEPCPSEVTCKPATSSISDDGSHVFFETSERVSLADTDDNQDIYDWSGGIATRVSTGAGGGNGVHNATFENNVTLLRNSSDNGAVVFFKTDEQLAVADTDNAQDVYARSGDETELVSVRDPSCAAPPGCGNGELPASLSWISPDGAAAILGTTEQLNAEDEDVWADVYARTLSAEPTTLVSQPGPTCLDPECGNEKHDARFAGASSGLTHMFFTTDEALAPPITGDTTGPGDRDEQTDVYDRSGGTTALVSAGQLGGEGLYSGNGPFDAFLQGASGDGAHAFLTTSERLTGEDHDSQVDVYERSPSGTLLVSQGNDPVLEAELAPPAPVLEGTDPASPNASTKPKVLGSEPIADASIKLYKTADCSGEPVATGSTAELKAPGIAVSVAAGSTTNFRATAEAEGFISLCSGGVTYVQQGEGASGGGGSPQQPQSKLAPDPGPLVPLSYDVPRTRITFGPAFKTRMRRPVFRFTDATGQEGTRFVCKVDRGRWKSCGSPLKLKKLSRGGHSFGVKGVNAVGVWQEKPSKRKFTVVAS